MDSIQPADLEQQRAFLRRLARELVRCPATADDVVQDAFVLALERPPAVSGALRSWLARVVRNLAANARRSHTRQSERERRVARPESQPAHDRTLESLELQEHVLAHVKALPEPYRTALWLRYHEGLAPRAIAEREGAPPRTVESRLARGLELLRAELDRSAGGDRQRWLAGVALLARAPRSNAPLVLGALTMKKLVAIGLAVAVLAVLWHERGGGAFRAPSTPEELAAGSTVLADVSAENAGVRVAALETPTPSIPPSASTGSLLVHVRWADGSDAPDVGLLAFAEDDPLGERHARNARTDATGRARVEGLHPGAVRVEADRGATVRTAVSAGAEGEVVLDLPAGVDVFGTVTDGGGTPVAGAEILLVSERRDWNVARPVGASGPGGSYRVRAATEGFALSARVPGLVPAALQDIEASAGAPVKIDLVLGSVGFALNGIVLDPARAPVAGALVAVGENRGTSSSFPDGRYEDHLGMPVVLTDPRGRFAASGIEPGGMSVAVMADGFPIQVAELPGWPGAVSCGEVVLESAGTIAGTVRTPDGAVVARATVSVLEVGGQRAFAVPFPLPRATSGADGRFRCELVAPGSVPLRVDPPPGSDLAPSLVRVAVAAGAECEVELQLSATNAIHGRALDADGAPLGGVTVNRMALDGSGRERATTDADGSFAFERCDAPPYELQLVEPGGWRTIARREDVGPGPEEIVIAMPPTGTVVGSLLDDGRRLPAASAEEEVLAVRAPQWNAYIADPRGEQMQNAAFTGEVFTCHHVPAGTYRLTLNAGSTKVLRTDWFDVRAGETFDVGVLRTPSAGALVVDLSDLDPATSGLSTVLRTSEYDVASFLATDGELRVARGLSPGTYWLSAKANGRAEVALPVEIRSGEELRVSLQLAPGVERTLALRLVDPAAGWRFVRIAVRADNGRLVAVHQIDQRVAPLAAIVNLPVGTFTLEAESESGLSARGTLAVLSLTPQEEPLTFELR